MKILVISDTHGNDDAVLSMITKHEDADILIHLGDNYTDALVHEKQYPDIRFEYVPGNCDLNLHNLSEWKILEENKVKLFITHGKRYNEMFNRAVKNNCDIFLFGHSHIPLIREDSGIMLLNPGSGSLPRGNSQKSYVVLYIEEGKYKIFKEVIS